MKKIFTSVVLLGAMGLSFGQVISQNADQNTVTSVGSVSCGSQAAGYTADNYYSRAFKLSDYAINYDYKITNIKFGVGDASADFDVTLNLYKATGAAYPNSTTTLLSSAPVAVGPNNNASFVNSGTSITQVIQAGGTFVVEVFHDGSQVEPVQSFRMGVNPSAESKPSYIKSETCSILVPTPVSQLGNFPNSKWVMVVTGENALGVTEVINARELQIFPNPVKDVLNFKLANGLKVEGVELYDMAGKKVNMMAAKASTSVNVANFPKGTYVLKVKASDGKVYIQKMLKN